MAEQISGLNQLLVYVDQLMQLYYNNISVVPSKFQEQVTAVKKLLASDITGLVNSISDFAISSANVDYSIKTSSGSFDKILNNWMENINIDLRFKIPIGINALAKEFYRERWKGSSLLILRTLWENIDGFEMPTKCWFVDGASVSIDSANVINLGEEKYLLQVNKDKFKELPIFKNEVVFVRKPFESWGAAYPIPFIIKRGIYKNAKIIETISNRGESFVAKAIEYLMAIKKGTEGLAKENRPEFIYSPEELREVEKNFQDVVRKKKEDGGALTYVTNFDTAIEHIIPDYSKLLNTSISAAQERRILAGFGFVEVTEGITSSRKDAVLNPRGFVSEVNDAVSDFSSLLDDLVTEIIIRNKIVHPKFTNNLVRVHHTPVKQFMDNDIRSLLRSLYDRGALSKRTLSEVVGDMDFDIEIERRKTEKEDGTEDLMTNQPLPTAGEKTANVTPIDPEMEDQEKTGPETLDYLGEGINLDAFAPDITKNYIRLRQVDPKEFDDKSFRIITISKKDGIKAVIGKKIDEKSTSIQSFLFEKEKWTVKEAQKWVKDHKDNADEDFVELALEEELEGAPYTTIKSLPDSVKNSLTLQLQRVWKDVFNQVYFTHHNEIRAIKSAWAAIKKIAEKDKNGKWHRKQS